MDIPIPIKKTVLTPRKVSKLIAEFASDTKAENVVVLDMRKVVNYCDYFVIASGNSDRHVRAIAEHISEELAKKGINIGLKQGKDAGEWIVCDCGDVVTHIFQTQFREFYGLEHLWQEAKVIVEIP